jgi:cation:H+ antiporter
MVWVQFFISAAVVVFAATKLAQYGDVIAVRARLSGMFIGTLLLAGATSLPELLSAINAIQINVPDLAAGSMFGSSMFNMLMLAILDLITQQARILRRVAMNHALTASLANLLMGLAVFFLLADIDVQIGWVGLDSLVIIGLYMFGIRIIQMQGGKPPSDMVEADSSIPSLKNALIGFGLAVVALSIATPFTVRSASQIAEITKISAGFIGATLLAITTSLPEMVATISAVKIRAYDLAIGNLFGSNLFNMFALGLTDVFYLDGRFLSSIDPAFALVGLLGLILTTLGLVGNIVRVERRHLGFIEVDALIILIGYLISMFFLYNRGIGV